MTDGDVAKHGERHGQPDADGVRRDDETVVEEQKDDPGERVAVPRVRVDSSQTVKVDGRRMRERPETTGRI